MTDEWVERRVADLEVGDDVRDYGPVYGVGLSAIWQGIPGAERYVEFAGFQRYMLSESRVDIRRTAKVTVENSGSAHRSDLYIDQEYIATLPKAHAEEYAARLRSSAHDRAAALGKDTT